MTCHYALRFHHETGFDEPECFEEGFMTVPSWVVEERMSEWALSELGKRFKEEPREIRMMIAASTKMESFLGQP